MELAPINQSPRSQNSALVYLASLSTEKSRAGMASTIDKLADILTDGRYPANRIDWSNLRFEHVQGIRSMLLEMYSPTTVNKYLSAIRGILKAAWQQGTMTAEDYQKATSIRGIKARTLPKGRELSSGEIRALMEACCSDQSLAGSRDAAIVALLYAGGLRRSEVVGLNLEDFTQTADGLASLKVRGKGRVERLVWLDNGALEAVKGWLKVRGGFDGPLFCRIRRGDHLQETGLTAQAVYLMLKARAAETGCADFSPHDFRRTFVSALLDAGADLSTVAAMAGHANVQTTARYDRRGEKAKQRAAKLLHVPYHSKI